MNNSPLDGVAQIVDYDSLEHWLRVVVTESGQEIAARAAMRVMPIGWEWLISTTGTEVTLPLLTCAFYATKPPIEPTKKLPQNVQTALFYNTDYSARAAATRNRGPSAVLAAINFAATATILPLSHSTRSASNAALSAASAYSLEMAELETPENIALAREDLWAEVRADCTMMCKKTDLNAAPLWSLQPPPFDAQWQKIKLALQDDPELKKWLTWYDSVLLGKMFSLDFQAEG